ncbi:DNase I-like protein [Phanerochaete sordida]|uniref:DNase I-like protein n=1 Tax=Phanerochaete sordida TaxID=48140 RepID=A0A9P3GK04_9APHY|nr:DNase I-like protein [Phanerochaete sordida]
MSEEWWWPRYGLWIVGEPSDDPRVSNGLRVYGVNLGRSVNPGDLISVSGRVAEYRAAYRPNDLLLTEIERPTRIHVHSSGHTVKPVVLGKDRVPPIAPLSAFDTGADGWLSVPNNVTLLEAHNRTLEPEKYGLDFWESLEGQLVTIESPTAVNFPDMFGSFWAHGGWPVLGKNGRGGVSLMFGPDGKPVAHSEAILIGKPIDGTRNPRTTVGMNLTSITGVLAYQFGFYSILPLTAPEIVSAPETEPRPASLHLNDDPCELTIGDYNVENMSPRSHHIPKIADHIANYLHTPDIVFVQEISDDSGAADNGVVSANKTLAALTKAIAQASGGVHYEFINIPPENNMDGGKPGSNIRVAYLWRPEKVSLVPGSHIGKATEATEVVKNSEGRLSLSLNPGRIEPSSIAWEETRKPLAAAWQTTSEQYFYTVNVHFSSKRDSSSTHGDARPPVNGHSERRALQVNVTANFVDSILALDGNASVIVGGDMNEFVQARSIFKAFDRTLYDINDVADVAPTERYTYVYEQHMQEIDQLFVSDAVARRGADVEHVHVNTWAASVRERASDHDPTVARVRVCDTPRGRIEPLVDQQFHGAQIPIVY